MRDLSEPEKQKGPDFKIRKHPKHLWTWKYFLPSALRPPLTEVEISSTMLRYSCAVSLFGSGMSLVDMVLVRY